MDSPGPIGIFDSGIGGLTIYRSIREVLPQYNYVYLGDNARVPYGTRSFDTVYSYTKECVMRMFDLGCRLVIVACNTASAKALRNIQQIDLPQLHGLHRVLGVIRPTTEIVGTLTRTGEVGVFATQGTVSSESYRIEIEKFFPNIKVYQQACPMWVPLVENNEHESDGADYFVQKYIDSLMSQSQNIDTILLACTHYPLLINKISKYLPTGIKTISQDSLVASSLSDYLTRHPEIEALCTRGGSHEFFTTESPDHFDSKASLFLDTRIHSRHLQL